MAKPIIKQTRIGSTKTKPIKQTQIGLTKHIHIEPITKSLSNLYQSTAYQQDQTYHELFNRGRIACQMDKEHGLIRQRTWDLLNWYKWNKHLDLPTAECGVFSGFSTWMMQNCYQGEHHLFDSFKGLSEATEKDKGTKAEMGQFSCGMNIVKHNLRELENLHFYKGWIPEIFTQLDQNKIFRFVYIDVDLYEPISQSLKFFWPRICSGGVIVVDDYGQENWPGVKHAVIEFCESVGKNCIPNSTGNVSIIKP